MRFSTTVELGAGKKPAVLITVNGHTHRSTVATMGGRFLLPLSAEHRTAAGVAAGDPVEVDVELDVEPRTVEVPADLAAALDVDPEVRRRFDALSYSLQRRHVLARRRGQDGRHPGAPGGRRPRRAHRRLSRSGRMSL
jgi:hypothetical protein